jgi:hypothetical protein
MEVQLSNYIQQGFCVFTFEGIVLNDKNKKQLLGMTNWKNININNFKEFCFKHHRALAVITGKNSNVTCLDFDVKDGQCSYQAVIEAYPELAKCKTIKTQSGGYHLYLKYDETIKTTVNAFEEFENVDIRNDDAILIAPPTKVYKDRNCCGEYTDLGGDIMEIPNELKMKLKQFNKQEKPVLQPKAKVHIEKATEPTEPTTQSKHIILELAKAILSNNSKFFDDYEKWSQLGYIIFNETNGSEEGENIYDEISKMSVKYENKQSVKKQYYNTQKAREKKLQIDALYSWLEKLEPDNELLDGRKKTKFASTDDEASDILYNELKQVFKSFNGRLFYLHENIWSHDEAVIDDIVLNYILKSNIYSGINEKTNKLIPFTQNISKAKKVQEALYSKIRIMNNDNELYEKFHDTTKKHICFNDGVLNFETKTFTLWEKVKANSIFPTIKINRNYHAYFNNPNHQVINDIKTKIFDVLYGDNVNLALQFLARSIAGHHEDKLWATYLGNRNSGKGVEYDLMASAFESYVSTFELGNMLYSRKTAGAENVDCSKRLYWLIDLEFVRLAVSQEIPDSNSGLQVNGKMLKKITGGGDVIVARRNYDRKDTHFKIDTSFYIKGNNTLICDTVDCDETRIEFSSVTQFKTQEEIDFMKQEGREESEMKRYKVKDATIKDKCKTIEWGNAMVYLLLQNYQNTAVTIPKSLDVEDNTLLGSLKSNFEFTHSDEDFVLCNDVHGLLSSYDKGKILLELTALNIFKKKSKKKGECRDKWCYFGIKKIEKDDLEI